MAARRVKIRHDEETRAKIKTSQLINRLSDHALGKIDLLPTQVRAIQILLRKTLPDLATIELRGNDEHPIHYVFSWKSDQSRSDQSRTDPSKNSPSRSDPSRSAQSSSTT